MQYLTRWRMQVAASLLATSHDGVAAIGARVGYAAVVQSGNGHLQQFKPQGDMLRFLDEL